MTKQKSKNDFCFLHTEKDHGIIYLTLLKGGNANDANALKRPMEIISVPIGGENDKSGREILYLPAYISMIQDFTEAAIDSDAAAYMGLKAIAHGVPNKVTKYTDPEQAAEVFQEQRPMSAVQVIVSPDGTTSSKPRYKLVFSSEDFTLYSFGKF